MSIKKGLKYQVFRVLKDSNLDVKSTSNKMLYDNYLVHVFMNENADTVKRAISEYRSYLADPNDVTLDLFNADSPLFQEKPADDGKHNILVIPDLHAPFIHKDALRFCLDAYDENDIDEVIFLGDIIDNHYSSFHDADPDLMIAGDEIRIAREQLFAWKEAFPIAKVMYGNHDLIPNRKAFAAGLSKTWVRSIDDVYDLKGWDFVHHYTVGRNYFCHGMGMNVVTRARQLGLNVFQGHLHSKFSCTLVSVYPKPTFAVQAGCLIDHNSPAFAYARDYTPQAKGVVIIKDALGNPEIIMKPMLT